MVAVALSALGGAGWQFLDNNGRPLNAGKLYTYAAGGTTPTATYQSSAGSSSNTNPIILDTYGRPPAEIWGIETQNYKFQLNTSANVPIRTYDNVPCIASAVDLAAFEVELQDFRDDLAADDGASLVGWKQAGAGALATTVEAKLRENLSVIDFGAINDGTLHTVAEWIIPGLLGRFANLAALQAAYPHVSSTSNSIDWAATQAAINYAIYNGNSGQTLGAKRKVRMPGGKGYVMSDAIQLGYGTNFNSIVLEGDGYNYRGAANFSGTAVICTFNDRMAFNFQGARGSVLRGVGILGLNYAYLVANLTTTNDTTAASWVNPAFPASADSRYAPYAAVTVDAYSGVAPVVAYPDVTYPSFLGVVAQYGKNFSSDCLVEDVFISGFVAGVVNQPCDADGNGDFTRLRRVSIEYCKYGVSVGNTQSRNLGMEAVKITIIYGGLTNNTHGKQLGKFNGAIIDLSGGSIIHLMQMGGLAFAGPLDFINCYMEGLWRIGDIAGGSSAENSVTFQGGHFNFTYQTDARGVPANVLGAIGTTKMFVYFKGCTFNNFPSVLSFGPVIVDLDGCTMSPSTRSSSAASAYIALAHNALCGGFVTYLLNNSLSFRGINFRTISPATLNVTGTAYGCTTWGTGGRNTSVPLGAEYLYPVNGLKLAYPFANPVDVVSKGSTTAMTLTNKTLTFNYTGRTANRFLINGPDNGDIIYDDQTGSVFFVRSRTGTAVTAELQNNYKTSGGGYAPVTAFSTTVGNLYFATSRRYATTTYLRGDFAIGSPIITNVADDEGTSTFDAEIAVGDAVGVYPSVNNYCSFTDSVITARDQGAQTITLTGNADLNLLRQQLQFFVKAPPGNV